MCSIRGFFKDTYGGLLAPMVKEGVSRLAQEGEEEIGRWMGKAGSFFQFNGKSERGGFIRG